MAADSINAGISVFRVKLLINCYLKIMVFVKWNNVMIYRKEEY